MKKLKIFSGLFLLVLLAGALFVSCEKDNIEPEPEPLPEPTDIGLGIRLSIDSIECIFSDDYVPDAGDNSDIELYGYIRAWSTFAYPSADQKQHYEKMDTSLLFFRAPEDLFRMNGGYGDEVAPEIIKIGKFTDFFFDNDKRHLTSINMDYFFADYDFQGEGLWEKSPEIQRLMFTEGTDAGGNVAAKPLVFNAEDIELYDKAFKRTYSLYLRDKYRPDKHKMVILVHYSFHPVPVKSAAQLPDGHILGEEFTEPDLYPEIPIVPAYAAAPPAKSVELVIGQKSLSKFSPEPMKLDFGGTYFHVYGINPKFVSGSQLIAPYFEQKEHVGNAGDDPWTGLVWFAKPQRPSKAPPVGEQVTGPTLQTKPIIQMVRYWVPINIERIPAGVTLTTSTEITHGIDAGFSYQYSISTGFSVGGDLASFNMEVSQTFGFSISYNYSITTTKTKEIAAPDDKNVAFITWQLIEEFRIVDENGELFTDPNYDFKSMMAASIPTDHIVEEAHQFSAN
ncbi:MAG: hypothetical protein R2830_18310 [Saprospiraceae bacterium]